MARIRSVKPQFWTSEQITDCSPNARLLFIGLWNFCDDYGVHPASPARLKMEVFPSDPFSKDDIRALVEELLEVELLREYEVSGARYWIVTGWEKHQKPDMKTGQYPMPDGKIGKRVRRTNTDNSPNGGRTNGEHSQEEKVLSHGDPAFPSQVGDVSTESVHGAAAAQKMGNSYALAKGGDDEF